MNSEVELITRAQEILKEIARGINPFTKEQIEESNFVNNPKMIRCFMFCAEMLERAKRPTPNDNTQFIITKEQKERINIQYDTIGFTQFCKIVNSVIDQSISKRAFQNRITLSLRTLGILGEEVDYRGGKKSVTIPTSAEYGFITVHKSVDGREFDQILANRKGQKYLIDNLEMLMGEVR